MKQQRTIFSFFGPPGSGKGTLAEQLVKQCEFQMLSTGSLCRKHVADGTAFGKSLETNLKNGHLIPDELITAMVIDWIQSKERTEMPIILDGYPRTKGQAAAFLDFLKNTHSDTCFRVCFIHLSDDAIVKRLTTRLVCENKNCQKIYTTSDHKTLCDACGSKLVTRDDDKEEVIRKRLALYPAYRDDLLGFYRDRGQSIEELNVADLSIDQVFATFMALNSPCKEQSQALSEPMK